MSYENLEKNDPKLNELARKADCKYDTYISLWTNDILLDGHWDYDSLPSLIEMLKYIVKNYKGKK